MTSALLFWEALCILGGESCENVNRSSLVVARPGAMYMDAVLKADRRRIDGRIGKCIIPQATMFKRDVKRMTAGVVGRRTRNQRMWGSISCAGLHE